MTSLLDESPLHEITVTALVKRAGVSRPTFYLHYDGDMTLLASDAGVERLRGMFPDEPAAEVRTQEELKVSIAGVLGGLIEHLEGSRSFYLHIMEGAPTLDLQSVAVELLLEQLATKSPVRGMIDTADPRTAIMCAGIVWFLMNWVRTDPTGRPPGALVVALIADALAAEFFPVIAAH